MRPRALNSHRREPRLPIARVPKVCGSDVEQGNFILGVEREGGTGAEAARALLREIDGLPRPSGFDAGSWYGAAPAFRTENPQDWGRKFLPTNGGCCYIDLDHLELCTPEVRSAHDHVAAWHAMLRILRQAQAAANRKLPSEQRLQVLVNNSDGRSHSYGSHLSFLLARRSWDEIFERRLHLLLWLASFQVSSIVVTGQGKVGAENGAPPAAYQISQRADFFETLCGEQTTRHRPLVNSRDESLCAERRHLARLHCIFFDSTLCHGSSLLRIGLMQIALAMIEAGETDTRLVLEDPVDAVRRWSRDPGLRARARLVTGQSLTAVDLQKRFASAARRFVSAGSCDGVVPGAEEILDLWDDTLRKLEGRDFSALAPRLDWVLKLGALRLAMQRRPDLDWSSAEIKHLDHLYGSLDPEDGLYWAFEASGAVEKLVEERRIEHLVDEPPEDTRAWTRANLLRLVPASSIAAVDWDTIVLRLPGSDPIQVSLPDPLAHTRAQMEQVIRAGVPLARILHALGATPVTFPRPVPLPHGDGFDRRPVDPPRTGWAGAATGSPTRRRFH